MDKRYLQDCKLELVKSGLLKTLPKSALRVLFVAFAISKWNTGTFESGSRGLSTLAKLDNRDTRAGINYLVEIGIFERLHKGVSALDRSVYRINLERIKNNGKSTSNGIPSRNWDKFLDTCRDGKIASECV